MHVGFSIPDLTSSGSALIDTVLTNRIVLAADPGAGGGLTQFLLLFGPLFVIWYFLVIRPQQQQRRKVQEMLSELKTGDRVITTGGIYGTIVGFRDSVVQLQVATQVKIDVARSAIGGLQPSEKDKPDK
jgi:preprotein translocase subunit YajC